MTLMTLFAAWQVVAQPPAQGYQSSTAKSSAIVIEKPKFHWLAPQEKVETRNNWEPVKGLSPRAWTTVVGWNTGESAFPDPVTHKSQLDLFWIGSEPSP